MREREEAVDVPERREGRGELVSRVFGKEEKRVIWFGKQRL